MEDEARGEKRRRERDRLRSDKKESVNKGLRICDPNIDCLSLSING